MRRLAALIFGTVTHVAMADDLGQVDRSALLVGVNQPSPDVPALVRAEQDIQDLAQTLRAQAGYARVATILGSEATAAAVIAELKKAVQGTTDEGVLLVVLVSHGAGGDIGEPAFLTHGGGVMDPQRTGLSLDAFGSALTPRTPDQNIVVLLDSSHDLGLNGVALIGPAATDWTQLPEWGVAVTSKASGLGGAEGVMVPAIAAALGGDGDQNYDGRVTISELSNHLLAQAEAASGVTLERSGAVAANLVLSSAGRSAPAAPVTTDVPDQQHPARATRQGQPYKLKPIPVAMVSVGAVAGIASMGMYISKMGECEDVGSKTVCGDDDAYRRFRMTQHILGWTGAGLVATGIGLQILPTPDGAMLGVVGAF